MFVTALFSATYGRKKMEKTGPKSASFVRCEAIEGVGLPTKIDKPQRINNL